MFLQNHTPRVPLSLPRMREEAKRHPKFFVAAIEEFMGFRETPLGEAKKEALKRILLSGEGVEKAAKRINRSHSVLRLLSWQFSLFLRDKYELYQTHNGT